MIEDAEPLIRALIGGPRLTLADLDARRVREVDPHPRIVHPGNRLQLALGALGVDPQRGGAHEVVDDGLHCRWIGVHVAGDRHPFGADREQCRAEHCERADDDDHHGRDQGHPLESLAALGTLDRDPPLAHPRFDPASHVAFGVRAERVARVVVLDDHDRFAPAPVEAALDVDRVGQVLVDDRDHHRLGTWRLDRITDRADPDDGRRRRGFGARVVERLLFDDQQVDIDIVDIDIVATDIVATDIVATDIDIVDIDIDIVDCVVLVDRVVLRDRLVTPACVVIVDGGANSARSDSGTSRCLGFVRKGSQQLLECRPIRFVLVTPRITHRRLRGRRTRVDRCRRNPPAGPRCEGGTRWHPRPEHGRIR